MSEALPPPVPPAVPPAAAPAPVLGGFWRRLAAFAVDALVLMLLGSGLGLVAAARLRALGPMGRVLGFLIGACYFTVLDGPAGGGRTAGKRLLGLRVVGEDGAALGWRDAAVRGCLLGAVLALNGFATEPDWRDPVTLSVGLFWMGILATAGLVAFERARRQGLHDLAAGSLVLRGDPPWSAPPPASSAVRACVLLFPLALTAASVPAQGWVLRKFSLGPMLEARKAVQARAGTTRVGVARNAMFMDGRRRDMLVVALFYYEAPEDPEETAVQAARAVLDSGYPMDGLDALAVNVNSGYQLGIANVNAGRGFVRRPLQWTMPAHADQVQRTSADDVSNMAAAAAEGRVADLEKILKAGADPNLRETDGDTPLLRAAAKGKTDSVKLLLDYSALADMANVNGVTPLMYACSAGDLAMAQALLAHRADPDKKDSIHGRTAVLYAVDAGRADLLSSLLAARGNPNAADADGHSAVWHARNAGHPDLVELLRKAGARD